MFTYRELTAGFDQLGLDSERPVLAHASLSAFGDLRGGVETLLGALLARQRAVMMPAFTYKTLLVPETGPQNNAIEYGSAREQNMQAEFFRQSMPVDPAIGLVAERLRIQPGARRSAHPVLSFCGVGVENALFAQTLSEPLAPVGILARQGGWVLLIGVNQTVNTAIHYAERLAGRPQFIRWALTYEGVRECPRFPGCSRGFAHADLWLNDLARTARVGTALIQAIPLQALLDRLQSVIRQDPQALLCDEPDCPQCMAVRQRLRVEEQRYSTASGGNL